MVVRLAVDAPHEPDWTSYGYEFPAEAKMRQALDPFGGLTSFWSTHRRRQRAVRTLPESMLAPTAFDASPDNAPVTRVKFVAVPDDDDLPGW